MKIILGVFALLLTDGSGFSLHTEAIAQAVKIPIATGLGGAYGIAISGSGEYAFVSEFDQNNITKVNLIDGAKSVVVVNLCNPQSLALSMNGTDLFVTEHCTGKLTRVSLTSGKRSTLTTGFYNSPQGLALSSDEKSLFVAEYYGGAITQLTISSGAKRTLSTNSVNGPQGLVISADGESLFVSEYGTGNILQLNIATRVKVTIATNLKGPLGLALSFDKTSLLVSEFDAGRVTQVLLASGNKTIIAKNFQFRDVEGVAMLGGKLLVSEYSAGQLTELLLEFPPPPPPPLLPVTNPFCWHDLFTQEVCDGTFGDLSLPPPYELDLDLSSYHGLAGTIPTEIGRCTNISGYADFSTPLLSGTIPTEIGMLVKLAARLSFGGSPISGTIPTEIGRLSELSAELDLSNLTALSGTIPTELGLVGLQPGFNPSLSLNNARLSGTIPTQLAKLNALSCCLENSQSAFSGETCGMAVAGTSENTNHFSCSVPHGKCFDRLTCAPPPPPIPYIRLNFTAEWEFANGTAKERDLADRLASFLRTNASCTLIGQEVTVHVEPLTSTADPCVGTSMGCETGSGSGAVSLVLVLMTAFTPTPLKAAEALRPVLDTVADTSRFFAIHATSAPSIVVEGGGAKAFVPTWLIVVCAILLPVGAIAIALMWWRARKAKSELSEHLLAASEAEWQLPLDADAEEVLACAVRDAHALPEADVRSRFAGEAHDLVMGTITDAARGLAFFLCIEEQSLREGLAEGETAIAREVRVHGDALLGEWFDYIMLVPASETLFSQGVCDQGRAGMLLADFVAAPEARCAGLSTAHVLALRLYTSPAFGALNMPLRDRERREAGVMHPLAITCAFVAEGIKKLRAVHAETEHALVEATLYRGLLNMEAGELMEVGGSEMAMMSTTSELRVAAQYSASRNALLLKLRVRNSMQRGADLQWLSIFPAEAECLYPPLTFLQPTGRKSVFRVDGATFTEMATAPTIPQTKLIVWQTESGIHEVEEVNPLPTLVYLSRGGFTVGGLMAGVPRRAF